VLESTYSQGECLGWLNFAFESCVLVQMTYCVAAAAAAGLQGGQAPTVGLESGYSQGGWHVKGCSQRRYTCSCCCSSRAGRWRSACCCAGVNLQPR
jgi:hypothetical protein